MRSPLADNDLERPRGEGPALDDGESLAEFRRVRASTANGTFAGVPVLLSATSTMT